MDIRVKPWKGVDKQYYAISIEGDNASLSEDWLEQKDVDDLAVSLLEDTALHKCYRNDVIGRLIDLQIIDLEMMKEYIADLEE